MRCASRLVALTDRAILRVSGENSGLFLQGLCTQDMQSLQIMRSAGHAVLPAAFLSPKGKVLCDTLVQQVDKHEFLVDCHADSATPLLRLLQRHRLRQPLTIENVSKSYMPFALLPPEAASESSTSVSTGNEPEPDLADSFFPDPRFAGMGQRALLSRDVATTATEMTVADYHRWRVCCGVPEGPRDMKVDEMMPLHVNMELLNFVSFSKGCYVGQELLTRTKHRGAVRRRFFIAVAADYGSSEVASLQDALVQLEPSRPLTARCITSTAESLQPEADPLAVFARSRHDQTDLKQVGTLQSGFQNVALCLLRCDGDFNDPRSFATIPPLQEDREVVTASGRSQILLRAPPYAFVEPVSPE
ncbi:CAF17 [Symbiodinium sp. CCMP2592]|nr:CAF17 [Symbiodinium sp. CCMP2592]